MLQPCAGSRKETADSSPIMRPVRSPCQGRPCIPSQATHLYSDTGRCLCDRQYLGPRRPANRAPFQPSLSGASLLPAPARRRPIFHCPAYHVCDTRYGAGCPRRGHLWPRPSGLGGGALGSQGSGGPPPTGVCAGGSFTGERSHGFHQGTELEVKSCLAIIQ